MTETSDKNATEPVETHPPSLNAVRDVFAEFNIPDVSDEICTRVLDILYSTYHRLSAIIIVKPSGHTCDVIEEAKAVSNHAGRTKIDESDMKLAINLINDDLMFSPPYREQLLAYAEKNEQPLPAIRPHCGLRLPAERYNLTAPNYSLLPSSESAKSVLPTPELNAENPSALHLPNSNATTQNMYLLSTAGTITPTNRSITVATPMGSSSVHVIAPPGIGPSMIRVQSVQSVAQLPQVDGSNVIRPISIGPTVSNVMSLNRRYANGP